MSSPIRHEERERELAEIARLARQVAEEHTAADHHRSTETVRRPVRRLFGARRPFWFALGFVVGFQLIGQSMSWRWPL